MLVSWLAWATMAAEDWTRTFYLANRVDSRAMSASMMRPWAASRLVWFWISNSLTIIRRDISPPFSARESASSVIELLCKPNGLNLAAVNSFSSQFF